MSGPGSKGKGLGWRCGAVLIVGVCLSVFALWWADLGRNQPIAEVHDPRWEELGTIYVFALTVKNPGIRTVWIAAHENGNPVSVGKDWRDADQAVDVRPQSSQKIYIHVSRRESEIELTARFWSPAEFTAAQERVEQWPRAIHNMLLRKYSDRYASKRRIVVPPPPVPLL